MIIDHNVLCEMFLEYLFWELVPGFSPLRERAEELVVKLEKEQSYFNAKFSAVIEDAYKLIETWHREGDENLNCLVRYIQFKRDNDKEELKLPVRHGEQLVLHHGG